MTAQLIKKSHFAELCGVSPAAVTVACRSRLKPALQGSRIDAAHPEAVAYREEHARKATPEPAAGIDPLYAEAVQLCEESGRWTANALRKPLGVGSARARRIFGMMQAAGVVPDPDAPEPPKPRAKPATPPAATPATPPAAPPVRGRAAAKEAIKAGPPVGSELTREEALEQNLLRIPEDIRVLAHDWTLVQLVDKFGTDVRFKDWLSATKSIEDINEKRLKNAATQNELVSRDLVKIGIIDPIDSAHLKLMTDGARTIARRVAAMHDAGRPMADLEALVVDQIASFIKPVKAQVGRTLREVENA